MPIAKLFKFNFKSRAIKGEDGAVIGRTKKQPSVECEVPTLAADEIVAYLSSSPESQEARIITDAVARIFIDAARDQFDEIIETFGDASDKEVTAAMLDYSKLSLEYLASLPPATRASSAITEEDWEVFFADYMQVMVAATGKAEDRIKNQINLFKKPTKAKSNKEVLQALVDQLNIYMATSAALEDTGACASRISEKFQRWIAEPEKELDLGLL